MYFVIFLDGQMVQNKQFQPKETLVFIRLIKYALQALDIYTLTSQSPPQPPNQRTLS